MCERQKIHVFLGAPPPPSSVSVDGKESESGPPAKWRHLELTWMDRRLTPATGESQSHTEEEDQCSALVHEYLNTCFPVVQPEPEEPEPELGAKAEVPRRSKHQLSAVGPPLCSWTQYLSTWTLSQALILRGRNSIQSASSPNQNLPPQTPSRHGQTPPSTSPSTPELFSPLTPSPASSAELFSQLCFTPRVQEGGVVLESTANGVLCSQEAESTTPAPDSPAKPPGSKRARIPEDSRAETPVDHRTVTELQGVITPLVHCHKPGVRYSVLVVVVHPCHLKEVKVKKGPSAGTFVPLASIVVTDQSDVEMKVVLWRRAAFWALTVTPGDILHITALQVNEDRWRGEMTLQSTFSSKLLNLGQISGSRSPPAPQHVNARSLSCLCGFLQERRPLLVSLPHHSPQDLNRLPYATLTLLRVNMLVHALLRVTHTHISSEWRSEAESRCRSARHFKAVLTVEQPCDQQGTLLLWGAAVDWLPRFNRDRVAVWDFHILLVRDSLTSDLPELHSTPWSSVRPLDTTDPRLQDFHKPQWNRRGTLELDLDTLLSQKYSGVVELRVQVFSFHFQDIPSSQNSPQPVLDGSTALDDILEALSGDITYVGCSRCSAELGTDTNGIYSPCYPCLPHTAVRRYYRPGVLTVSGQGCSQVCVQVPPVSMQTILDAPPDKLHSRSAVGSQVKHIQVAAERIQNLISLPRQTFIVTIQSHFLCDENSIPLSQDFTLLDLQFPQLTGC